MNALPSMTVERARELLRRQATPPTPATPPVRYCRCGYRLSAGVRVGPAVGQRTAVLICWECGFEEPSLYKRNLSERGGRFDARRTTEKRVKPWR